MHDESQPNHINQIRSHVDFIIYFLSGYRWISVLWLCLTAPFAGQLFTLCGNVKTLLLIDWPTASDFNWKTFLSSEEDQNVAAFFSSFKHHYYSLDLIASISSVVGRMQTPIQRVVCENNMIVTPSHWCIWHCVQNFITNTTCLRVQVLKTVDGGRKKGGRCVVKHKRWRVGFYVLGRDRYCYTIDVHDEIEKIITFSLELRVVCFDGF